MGDVDNAIKSASKKLGGEMENTSLRQRLRKIIGGGQDTPLKAGTVPTNYNSFIENYAKEFGVEQKDLKEGLEHIEVAGYSNGADKPVNELSEQDVKFIRNVPFNEKHNNEQHRTIHIAHGAFPKFNQNVQQNKKYSPTAAEKQANKNAVTELVGNLFAGLDTEENDVFIIALPGAFYEGLDPKAKTEYNQHILDEITRVAESKSFPLDKIIIAGQLNKAELPKGMKQNNGKDILAIAARLHDEGLNPVVFDNAHNVNSVGNGALGDRADKAFEENLFRRVPLAYMLDNTFRDKIQQSLKAEQVPTEQASSGASSTASLPAVKVVSATTAEDRKNWEEVTKDKSGIKDPNFKEINDILNETNKQKVKGALNKVGITTPSEIGNKPTTKYYRDKTEGEKNKLIVEVKADDLNESVIKLVLAGKKVNLSAELVEQLNSEAKEMFEQQAAIRKEIANQEASATRAKLSQPNTPPQPPAQQKQNTGKLAPQPDAKAAKEYNELFAQLVENEKQYVLERQKELTELQSTINNQNEEINAQDAKKQYESLLGYLNGYNEGVQGIEELWRDKRGKVKDELKAFKLSDSQKGEEAAKFAEFQALIKAKFTEFIDIEQEYLQSYQNRLSQLEEQVRASTINDQESDLTSESRGSNHILDNDLSDEEDFQDETESEYEYDFENEDYIPQYVKNKNSDLSDDHNQLETKTRRHSDREQSEHDAEYAQNQFNLKNRKRQNSNDYKKNTTEYEESLAFINLLNKNQEKPANSEDNKSKPNYENKEPINNRRMGFDDSFDLDSDSEIEEGEIMPQRKTPLDVANHNNFNGSSNHVGGDDNNGHKYNLNQATTDFAKRKISETQALQSTNFPDNYGYNPEDMINTTKWVLNAQGANKLIPLTNQGATSQSQLQGRKEQNNVNSQSNIPAPEDLFNLLNTANQKGKSVSNQNNVTEAQPPSSGSRVPNPNIFTIRTTEASVNNSSKEQSNREDSQFMKTSIKLGTDNQKTQSDINSASSLTNAASKFPNANKGEGNSSNKLGTKITPSRERNNSLGSDGKTPNSGRSRSSSGSSTVIEL